MTFGLDRPRDQGDRVGGRRKLQTDSVGEILRRSTRRMRSISKPSRRVCRASGVNVHAIGSSAILSPSSIHTRSPVYTAHIHVGRSSGRSPALVSQCLRERVNWGVCVNGARRRSCNAASLIQHSRSGVRLNHWPDDRPSWPPGRTVTQDPMLSTCRTSGSVSPGTRAVELLLPLRSVGRVDAPCRGVMIAAS